MSALPSLACADLPAITSVPGTSQLIVAGTDLCQEPQSPVALRWNGSSWAVMHMTSPKIFGQISEVTALSATDVWAAGIQYPDNDAKIAPLLEHWNGTTWAIVPAPSIGNDFGILLGIASDSPDSILAAGSSWCTASSCPTRTLAFYYNGANWTAVSTPNPATGTNSDGFSAVSPIPGTTQFWGAGNAGANTMAAFSS